MLKATGSQRVRWKKGANAFVSFLTLNILFTLCRKEEISLFLFFFFFFFFFPSFSRTSEEHQPAVRCLSAIPCTSLRERKARSSRPQFAIIKTASRLVLALKRLQLQTRRLPVNKSSYFACDPTCGDVRKVFPRTNVECRARSEL